MNSLFYLDTDEPIEHEKRTRLWRAVILQLVVDSIGHVSKKYKSDINEAAECYKSFKALTLWDSNIETLCDLADVHFYDFKKNCILVLDKCVEGAIIDTTSINRFLR